MNTEWIRGKDWQDLETLYPEAHQFLLRRALLRERGWLRNMKATTLLNEYNRTRLAELDQLNLTWPAGPPRDPTPPPFPESAQFQTDRKRRIMDNSGCPSCGRSDIGHNAANCEVPPHE